MISTKKLFPINPQKDLISQQLAYAVSLVFHPLMLPTLFLGMMFFTAPPEVMNLDHTFRWSFLGIIFIMTFIFPICITAIVLLSRKPQTTSKPGEVSDHLIDEFFQAFPEERKKSSKDELDLDLQMHTIQDRKVVFSLVTVIYIIATVLFKLRTFKLIPELSVILICITASLFVLTFITFYWKISAHGVAMGGLLGILFAFSQQYGNGVLMYQIIATVILAGVVMTARLYLDAHKPDQIFAGMLMGFEVNYLILLFFLKIIRI